VANRWAPLAVVAAAVLWGTTGTAQALGPDETTPLGVGATRIAVGGLALAAVMLGTPPSVQRRTRTGAVAVVIGAAAVATYQVSFFAATDRAGVALATIVAIGSGPLFAGALHTVITREAPSGLWALATALAVTGGALLVAGGSNGGDADAVGVLYALAAGLSYAVFSTAAKQLLDRGWPEVDAMAALFVGGAVFLAPLLVMQPLGWLATWRGMAMVAHLGLVAVCVAYLLYAWGLRWLAVPTVVTLTLAEPLTATFLGVVVLDERLPASGWIGAALVLVGLVLVGRGATARERGGAIAAIAE
jgi:DME family drug/metabolite transporter